MPLASSESYVNGWPLTGRCGGTVLTWSMSAAEQDGNEWQELGKCVLPMIEMLPQGYREALVLAEIDGLSLKEVAERLGLSLPGAKSRVQRGREKLKKIFLECCHFKFDCRGNPIDWSPKKECDRISC